MGGRDTSPLGIPKSPSFHSGLDLVASASVDSLVSVQTTSSFVENERNPFGSPEGIAKASRVLNSAYVGYEIGKSDLGRFEIPAHRNASAVRAEQLKGHLPVLIGDDNLFTSQRKHVFFVYLNRKCLIQGIFGKHGFTFPFVI